jgi:hypothetical protein
VTAIPSWFAFSDALARHMASDAKLPGHLRVFLLACTNMSRAGLATFQPGQLAERLNLAQQSVDRSLAELRQRGLIDPGSNSERIMVHWSYPAGTAPLTGRTSTPWLRPRPDAPRSVRSWWQARPGPRPTATAPPRCWTDGFHLQKNIGHLSAATDTVRL